MSRPEIKSQSVYFLSTICIFLFISAGCKSAINKETEPHQTKEVSPKGFQGDTINNRDTTHPIYLYSIITDKKKKFLLDTIANLEEVKGLTIAMERNTNDKNHLIILTSNHAELVKEGYYPLKVSEDNAVMLFTHYNFHVHPLLLRIMYYDFAKERDLTLEDWRKEGNSIKNKKQHQ